jgi:hypothetical protein
VVTGKDGNPFNEVELPAASLMRATPSCKATT